MVEAGQIGGIGIHTRIAARTRVIVVACATVFAVTVGACAAASPATFDPSAPCRSDVRTSGAYPALEALIPKSFEGRPPDQLDSGRNCTDTNLGTLTGHGIREVRFAGGLWKLGATSGITLAVFEADGLTAPFLGEWYEASARDATNTTQITPTRPMIGDRQAYRLDTVNGESKQTVIVWPSASGDVMQVVLAADVPETTIQDAIKAFG